LLLNPLICRLLSGEPSSSDDLVVSIVRKLINHGEW
jgi:hypothetical protein